MKDPISPLILAICAAVACAPLARGAVTYVDATMLNTDNAAGGLDSTWLDGNDASVSGTKLDGAAASDSKWRYRQGFGSGGIFEATGGSNATAENAVPILTTIPGLADGTYNIYVFFRASSVSTENYNIKASLSPTISDSDVYRQNNTRGLTLGTLGIDSAALTFAPGAAPVPNTPVDPRVLLYGIIGQAVVSGGNDVQIYIDDLPAAGWLGAGTGPGGSGSESTVRTWYDGVGYELVPEPSSALLGTIGLLALLRRRRVG